MAWTAQRRNDLLFDLARRGLLDEPRFADPAILGSRWAKARALDAVLDGTREIEGRVVGLRVGLGARFPHELPNVYVRDIDSVPFLPHVDRLGWVCFAASEGISVRASTPDALVEEAVDRALVTVGDGLTGRSARDVYDELEAYWRDLHDGHLVAAHLDPHGASREILVAFARVRQKPAFPYVADDFASVPAFDPGAKRHPSEKAALLVRLSDSCIDEPLDPRRFADAAWTRAYVQRHLTADDQLRVRALAARKKLWPFVVLNVPRPAGGRSLVGVHYEQVQKGHPFGMLLSIGATGFLSSLAAVR
jgi:hypothetical protein